MKPILDYTEPSRSEQVRRLLKITRRWVFWPLVTVVVLSCVGYYSNRISTSAAERYVAAKIAKEIPPVHHVRIGSARSVMPFITRVKYFKVEDKIGGSGGRVYFLCLFGWLIPLGDDHYGLPHW